MELRLAAELRLRPSAGLAIPTGIGDLMRSSATTAPISLAVSDSLLLSLLEESTEDDDASSSALSPTLSLLL